MPDYVALIRKEETSSFWIDAPDMPGCVAGGGTEEEALQNFEEAIHMHAEALTASGAALPEPRPTEIVLAEAAKDGYLRACIVSVTL